MWTWNILKIIPKFTTFLRFIWLWLLLTSNARIHSTINSFSIPSFSSHSLTPLLLGLFFMNEISFMCMRPHFFCYFYFTHTSTEMVEEKWHEELIKREEEEVEIHRLSGFSHVHFRAMSWSVSEKRKACS